LEKVINNHENLKLMIRAIIFDLWNTLFVLNLPHHVMRIAELFNMELNDSFFERYCKHTNLSPSRDLRSQAQNLLREFQINVSEESINAVVKALTITSEEISEYPETFEVLKELKKDYKIGLLTNVEPQLFDVFSEKYRPQEFFDAIVTSFDMGAVKPDKIMFQTILEKLGENRDTVVMVGDSFKSDIRGAENFGITAYLIDRENKNPQFERRITHLSELKKFLK